VAHKNIFNRVTALFAGILLLLMVSIPAQAITNSNSSNNSSESASQQSQSSQSGSDNASGSSQAAQVKGLNDVQKKVCQQSENRVQNMFSNMNKLGDSQLAFMNTINERVQNFYKISGLAATGYEDAVAEVTKTQQAAQEQVQATTQTSSQYGCDKEDPKGTAQQYKTQVKSEINALKEYRTALKNLITVVKSSDGGQQ